MPGRKSNVSTTSNGAEEVAEPTPVSAAKQAKEKDGLSVDDLSLPKSMIARLAKGVLPANTQIHKDALLALHKSATVFVSYIASNSNDNAQAAGKKTIAPQDVFAALKDAELEHFLPRLEAELKKYNETQCDKRNTYRRKIKEEKAAAAVKDGGEDDDQTSAQPKEGDAPNGGATTATEATERSNEQDSERPVKKLKGENGEAAINDPEDDADDDDEQDADDNDDDADEDGADDDVAEEESEDETQAIEDALEEQPDLGGMRDEALDDPDSD